MRRSGAGARAAPIRKYQISASPFFSNSSESDRIARVVPLQDKQIMASGGGTAVTTQPRSKRKEVEKFVSELDPTQVVGE